MAPHPERRGMEKYKRKLLILSVARSGTQYITALLRNCGFKIGHEGFKREGTVGMFFAVEDVWYPGKHWNDDDGFEDESRQKRSDYDFEQVWHMVRDPRRVIPSLSCHTFPPYLWCWQERHTGISCGIYPKELRAMLFWVAWNELIEQNEKIDLFFRVENVADKWEEICQRTGIAAGTPIPDLGENDYGSQEHGPRRPTFMPWEKMESIDLEAAKRVREMAERYGYE